MFCSVREISRVCGPLNWSSFFSCPSIFMPNNLNRLDDMRAEGYYGLRPDIALDEVVWYPDFLFIRSSHPREATQPSLHLGLGPGGGVWTLEPGWVFWTLGLEPGWVCWTQLWEIILGPQPTCGPR